MNRKPELTGILFGALASQNGAIYKVLGDSPSKRQTAITALVALKRELLPDNPDMLNLQIKAVPGVADEIAIRHLQPEADDVGSAEG